MAYSLEAAGAEQVEEDYVLIARRSFKGEEPAGYYVADLRTKEPWLILKTCRSCGNGPIWMKQVLMSLKDNINRRVAECPICHSLLSFKPDETDLTESVEPEEAAQQKEGEAPTDQTATPTAGDNGPRPGAEAPASATPD